MSRILVTGADGQLGRSVREIAKTYKHFEFIFRNSKTLDITNPQEINQLFSESHFDYCINCAAYTNVEQAEKSPELAHAVNAEGVRYLALACSESLTKLIHVSTDYVFDGKKETPYRITDKTNPINVYGESKLAGEKYIQLILKEHFIIRTSWLYSKYGKNFYNTILEKAKTEEVLKITDEQKGCPTKTSNLAKYILNIIATKNKAYGLYHFTDGEAMTWYDFALLILKENDLLDSVQVKKNKNYRTFAKRPKNSILE